MPCGSSAELYPAIVTTCRSLYVSVIELLIDNATDDTLRDGSLSVRSIPEAETNVGG